MSLAQDNAYLHPESWKVLQVTAWIPMLDATRHNGCMQVQCAKPGSGTWRQIHCVARTQKVHALQPFPRRQIECHGWAVTQVVRRGHLAGKTVKHSCCVGGTWCASYSWPAHFPS